MQNCIGVVVSVPGRRYANQNFENFNNSGLEFGQRFLYNRELGLISYNHKEELLGSWHELDYTWRTDDGFENGLPLTGVCDGEVMKPLPQPMCQVEGIVVNNNVHHFFNGIGVALDVDYNYMTLWHDHLGLVVHFGENLVEKFQALQPVNMKTQACSEHRLFGFHATKVTPASDVRLSNLYFAKKAKVEAYDQFLVAKCRNNHRVVLLDKKRSLEKDLAIGETINIAYYRILTAFGPMFISGFVTKDRYFDLNFDSLCKNRKITDDLYEDFTSSKSQVDRLAPGTLRKLAEEHLDCWNVDHCDVSWYTNRFSPESPILVREDASVDEDESDEEKEEPEVKEEVKDEVKREEEFDKYAHLYDNDDEEEEEEKKKEVKKQTKEAEFEEEVEEVEKTTHEDIKEGVKKEVIEAEEVKKEVPNEIVKKDENMERKMEEELEKDDITKMLNEEKKKKIKEIIEKFNQKRENGKITIEKVKEVQNMENLSQGKTVENQEVIKEVLKLEEKEKILDYKKLSEEAHFTAEEEEEEEEPKVSLDETIVKEVQEDKNGPLELDLGDLTDDTLQNYGQLGPEEEERKQMAPLSIVLPKAAEPVHNLDNKENHPIVAPDRKNLPALTHLPNSLQTLMKPRSQPELQLNPAFQAKFYKFMAESEESLKNKLQDGISRRIKVVSNDLISPDKVIKRDKACFDRQVPLKHHKGENHSSGESHPGSRPSSRASGGPSPSPVGGLPHGRGAPIPKGLVRQTTPSPPPATPPPSSSKQVFSGSPRRIQIVPRTTSSSFSNSGSTSGSSGSGGLNRSFGTASQNYVYLDMGPLKEGETVENYLERVVDPMDSRESKTIRYYLNQIIDNYKIKNVIKKFFPIMMDILNQMYEKPNLVSLPSLEIITKDRRESFGSGQIDRISMEYEVFEMLKNKSKPIWDIIRKEIPYVDGY